MKVAATTIDPTAADLAEIKRRLHEGGKLIARLAATTNLEEQQRLADELCPRFDGWIRGRNRIQSTPARQPRVVAIIAPRARDRERRPAETRRTASSSTTSSSDPGGDPEPSPEPGVRWTGGGWLG